MPQPHQPRLPPQGEPSSTGGGQKRSQYSRRSSRGGVNLLAALSHLTDRDLAIADWLDRHGVFTTGQLATAFFTSPITASHRLAKLRDLTLVDRFHRPLVGGGFGPWHWVIGPLGAGIAAARDVSPPTARALRERHARLAASSQLIHRLGTNQFFVDLHAYARRSDGAVQLVRWWSDRETADRYLRRIHPDGHALWSEDATTIGLFLEYDSGSQHLDRLVGKLDAYDQLARDGGPAYPVLFWLHATARERHLHQRLAGRRPGPVAVATAVRGTAADPAGPVWALVGDPHPRRRLVDLPHDHGLPDSPYNPHSRDSWLEPDT
jgi:hypothetical protein